MENNKINILLIEDSHSFSLLIKEGLDPLLFNIRTISNGQAAYDFLLNVNKDIDVVLVDYHLPGLDGISIMRTLREKNIEYPYVFMTADNTIDTAVRAMREGAYDFIEKNSNILKDLPEILLKVNTLFKNKLEKDKILEDKRLLLESIIEHAPITMFLVNSKGEIEKANRAGLEFIRKEKDDIYNKRIGLLKNCINTFGGKFDCGTSKFCEQCKINCAIINTFETGKTHFQIEDTFVSIIDGIKETSHLLISTSLIKEEKPLVLLSINDITDIRLSQNAILKAIINTEDKERERFAKDLHDGLGPTLSTIKLYLNSFARVDKTKQNYIVGKTNELIDDAIMSIKSISNNLSPHILTNLGFDIALNNFCRIISETTNIELDCQCNLKRRINDVVEVNLYRISNELLNNATKHSEATKVKLLINDLDSEIYYKYEDNGKGFNLSETIQKNYGMGLNNITTRLNSMNVNFNISSEIGNGFSIEFTVKL